MKNHRAELAERGGGLHGFLVSGSARTARCLLCLGVVFPLVFLSAGVALAAKPVVSKTAPRLKPSELEGPKGKLKSETAEGASVLPTPENMRTSSETIKSISQNIEAPSRDEVPIVLDPPPTDLPFKDVVGFARPGQTEKVLTGPVDHLPANEILGLAVLDFRQAVNPVHLRIPSPPFFRMEVPSGFESAHWSFQVEDQSEQTVYQTGGMQIPRDLVVWDGFTDDVMVIRAGVVYQPVLKMVDARGNPQQFFGDPIKLDVLQFDQGGVRHVEFRNHFLFQSDSSDLAVEGLPLVQSLLNIMRENGGSPYRVVVHEDEGGGALAQKRLEKLKRFLEDALVLDPENFSFSVEPSGSRGPVTAFFIQIPEGGS
ncbi:MAG: hypothetical protein IPN90_10590 [Elusimicrobia bacterium]|nr:hypothetical protein [Elusimicrobiota bacterium]